MLTFQFLDRGICKRRVSTYFFYQSAKCHPFSFRPFTSSHLLWSVFSFLSSVSSIDFSLAFPSPLIAVWSLRVSQLWSHLSTRAANVNSLARIVNRNSSRKTLLILCRLFGPPTNSCTHTTAGFSSAEKWDSIPLERLRVRNLITWVATVANAANCLWYCLWS